MRPTSTSIRGRKRGSWNESGGPRPGLARARFLRGWRRLVGGAAWFGFAFAPSGIAISGVEEIPGIGVPATPPAPSAPASTPSKITTSNPRVDVTPSGSEKASPSGATGAGAGASAGQTQAPAANPGAASANALGMLRGARRRYSGRRIDLDFKGADIHNILRLLSDVGQVNIVTSDDVKGEVTIKMRNVPWDQALDVILRSKLLGQVREGNLIRVAPLAILEKELEQEIARQKQLADVLPTETRIIAVSYADAKNLQDRAHDLLTGRGRISVDERTNQLIVSDVSANLNLVEDLVRSLDRQTSQVVIEARIVEAGSTFARQIGVQWGGAGFRDAAHGNATGLVFPSDIAVGGGSSAANATGPGGLVSLPAAASPDFAVDLPAAVGAGSGGALGLMLGSVGGAFNLNLRLSALENTGQVRILSSPRISTMDNIEASIEQGVSIPISIISAQGIQTIFVDAKLNLTVKPHVTNEGTIIMNIHVSRNEPDFARTGARGDPTIVKKEAKTVMLVRDGDTAVIGGIYQRNSALSYAKVPFFADLPIIGFFFRNRRENDDRTEFLVFITPRIANRGETMPAEARR
jgi:type IV pilus assembly protein PilQ